MKNIIYFFFVCIFNSTVEAQVPSLIMACGKAPNIDGTVSPGEWDDADTLRVFVASNKMVRISFKRDIENMYFLFAGNLESQVKFPELLFDVDNAKSAGWQADDWWFHVSANDCEKLGAYDVYTNCALVQPDWKAVKNITQGQPITDTVEVSIPFSKIGFMESDTNTRFGFCFVLNGFNGGSSTWPPLADKSNPSTWGDMIMERPYCDATGIPANALKHVFTVFPNPSPGTFSLMSEQTNLNAYRFQLFDVFGNSVPFTSHASPRNIAIHLETKPGIYFLHAQHDYKPVQTIKLIVN